MPYLFYLLPLHPTLTKPLPPFFSPITTHLPITTLTHTLLLLPLKTLNPKTLSGANTQPSLSLQHGYHKPMFLLPLHIAYLSYILLNPTSMFTLYPHTQLHSLIPLCTHELLPQPTPPLLPHTTNTHKLLPPRFPLPAPTNPSTPSGANTRPP